MTIQFLLKQLLIFLNIKKWLSKMLFLKRLVLMNLMINNLKRFLRHSWVNIKLMILKRNRNKFRIWWIITKKIFNYFRHILHKVYFLEIPSRNFKDLIQHNNLPTKKLLSKDLNRRVIFKLHSQLKSRSKK